MTGITRRYECWYAMKNGTTDEMITQIKSLYPNLDENAVEDHTANPLITPGKALVTLNNTTGEFHRELIAHDGIESFD